MNFSSISIKLLHLYDIRENAMPESVFLKREKFMLVCGKHARAILINATKVIRVRLLSRRCNFQKIDAPS